MGKKNLPEFLYAIAHEHGTHGIYSSAVAGDLLSPGDKPTLVGVYRLVEMKKMKLTTQEVS